MSIRTRAAMTYAVALTLMIAGLTSTLMGCSPANPPAAAPTTPTSTSAPQGLDSKVSPLASCDDPFRDTTKPCVPE